eukprot:ANDGO_04008.mRNA.1 hypothetical protein
MGLVTIVFTAILSAVATTYSIDTVRHVKKRVAESPLGLALQAVRYLSLAPPKKPSIENMSEEKKQLPARSGDREADVFDVGAAVLRRQLNGLSFASAASMLSNAPEMLSVGAGAATSPWIQEAVTLATQFKDYVTADDIRRSQLAFGSRVRVEDEHGIVLDSQPIVNAAVPLNAAGAGRGSNVVVVDVSNLERT